MLCMAYTYIYVRVRHTLFIYNRMQNNKKNAKYTITTYRYFVFWAHYNCHKIPKYGDKTRAGHLPKIEYCPPLVLIIPLHP